MGILDEDLPPDQHGGECRVAFITPYGIRYRYYPERQEVYVDTMTDERFDTMTRFL